MSLSDPCGTMAVGSGATTVGSPVDQAISTLNSIQVGDLDTIARRLQEVRGLLQELDQGALLDTIDEAQQAIMRGDAPLFRKRLQHVVSKLGHLR